MHEGSKRAIQSSSREQKKRMSEGLWLRFRSVAFFRFSSHFFFKSQLHVVVIAVLIHFCWIMSRCQCPRRGRSPAKGGVIGQSTTSNESRAIVKLAREAVVRVLSRLRGSQRLVVILVVHKPADSKFFGRLPASTITFWSRIVVPLHSNGMDQAIPSHEAIHTANMRLIQHRLPKMARKLHVHGARASPV
nr:hypothetical protein CFP56_00230 [Quercus suber]